MADSAFVFPGQGSQVIGMGREMAAAHGAANRIFKMADEVLGFPLSKLCWEGPADELTKTVNTQPAVVVTSLACLAALEQEGISAGVVSGHSVGELSALVAAGVVSAEAAIRLARQRGEFMEASGAKRPGGMAAVLNLSSEVLEDVCRQASSEGIGTVVLANINAPEQLVISGDVAALQRAEELALVRGARKIIALKVGGAFHSPLMEDAALRFATSLDSVSFAEPRIPVVSGITARAVTRAAELKDLLKRQMTSQILWEDTLRTLLSLGVGHVIEVGPGAALSGMLKRVDRTTEALRASDPDSLRQVVTRVLQKT